MFVRPSHRKDDGAAMNWLLLPTLATVALVTGACSGCASHSCTAIGYFCGNTNLTLTSPSDAWAAGTYTLTLTTNGASEQCTIPVPGSAPPDAIDGSCPSDSGVDVKLVPILSCPPAFCDAGTCTSAACTPIAGHFQLVVTLQEIPSTVVVSVLRDGKALLSETVSPTSATTEPNGHGCGTCTNASATLSVSAG
jgi:hypothetical protein